MRKVMERCKDVVFDALKSQFLGNHPERATVQQCNWSTWSNQSKRLRSMQDAKGPVLSLTFISWAANWKCLALMIPTCHPRTPGNLYMSRHGIWMLSRIQSSSASAEKWRPIYAWSNPAAPSKELVAGSTLPRRKLNSRAGAGWLW